MKSISDIIQSKKNNRDYRNSYEFQAYGNRLAEEFNDLRHRALYIKLAKEKDRKLLEAARDFVMNQEHVDRKGRLFMWKLKELENARLDETEKKN